MSQDTEGQWPHQWEPLVRSLLPQDAASGWHDSHIRKLAAGFHKRAGLLGECLQA